MTVSSEEVNGVKSLKGEDQEKTRASKTRASKVPPDFDKSMVKIVDVPEWHVLLALSSEGPQSMYQVAKAHGLHYPGVHRATKSLEKIRWIRVVEKKLSIKKVVVKVYGLTSWGLLWLFSRVPGLFSGPLVGPSQRDWLFSRKVGIKKASDRSEVGSLRSQRDVYKYLALKKLDFGKIAEKNAHLFPLVLGKWRVLKQGRSITRYLAQIFPRVAYTTILEVYFRSNGTYVRSSRDYGTIEEQFAYNLFRDFLETYAKHVGSDPTRISEGVNEVRSVFERDPELSSIFRIVANDVREAGQSSLVFLERVLEDTE